MTDWLFCFPEFSQQWIIQPVTVQRGFTQWQGAGGQLKGTKWKQMVCMHMDAYKTGSFCCWRQTPEKRATEQRSRKRKGDVYDSNSQGEPSLELSLARKGLNLSPSHSFCLKRPPSHLNCLVVTCVRQWKDVGVRLVPQIYWLQMQ